MRVALKPTPAKRGRGQATRAPLARGNRSRSPGVLRHADILQLQREVGNQVVARTLEADRRHHAPAIQRMNTSEAYYQNSLHRARIDGFAREPAMSRFISNLRMYTLLAANRASRGGAQSLIERLRVLMSACMDLPEAKDNYILKVNGSRLSEREKAIAREGLDQLVPTALDDVQQEIVAISTLYTNPQLDTAGMTWQQALFFARAGVPLDQVLREGNLAPGKDGGPAGDPEKLGGGQVSEVTAMTFNTGRGGTERQVFKPNEVNPDVSAGKLDDLNIQTAYRNLAAGRVEGLIADAMARANRDYEKLLGTVTMALIGGKIGTASSFSKGKEGLRANFDENGRQLSQTSLNVDPSNITIQRQASNLQLLDIIIGQLDRHMGNVLVQQQGGFKVSGIDNDFGFSQWNTTTNSNAEASGKTIMPTIVDKYFAEAVLSISNSDFMAALQGLTKAEIAASVRRFADVKAKLRTMDEGNRFVALWGIPTSGRRSERGTRSPSAITRRLGGSPTNPATTSRSSASHA